MVPLGVSGKLRASKAVASYCADETVAVIEDASERYRS